MSTSIAFQSHVPASQRPSLEALLFFNACQARVSDSIADAVERFGPPEIVAEGARLRVRIDGLDDVQCLFAVEPISARPVGVAVYMRPDLEHIRVLHLSIASEYATGGGKAHVQLLLRLLRELRRCTRRVKGIRHLELYYAAGRSQQARSRLQPKDTA